MREAAAETGDDRLKGSSFKPNILIRSFEFSRFSCTRPTRRCPEGHVSPLWGERPLRVHVPPPPGFPLATFWTQTEPFILSFLIWLPVTGPSNQPNAPFYGGDATNVLVLVQKQPAVDLRLDPDRCGRGHACGRVCGRGRDYLIEIVAVVTKCV